MTSKHLLFSCCMAGLRSKEDGGVGRLRHAGPLVALPLDLPAKSELLLGST